MTLVSADKVSHFLNKPGNVTEWKVLNGSLTGFVYNRNHKLIFIVHLPMSESK